MRRSANVRTRFAPSPTGSLHLGNARTALFNWLVARQHDGDLVLRIEDTDRERSTSEAELEIITELHWLGIDWHEGPDCGGPFGPYRQSERQHEYEAAIDQLSAANHLYPCFCSAAELEAARRESLKRGVAPRYSGACRSLSSEEGAAKLAAGSPHALRFKAPDELIAWEDLVHGHQAVHGAEIGDFVLLRSDGSPTYNLAAAVDDVGMAITHVVRGDDHLPNTPRQIPLITALGAKPPRFAHLPLLVDAGQRPLSKREASSSLAHYRKQGFLAAAVRNFLALLGWSHPDAEELLDSAALLQSFDLSRVRRSPASVNWQKLQWLNATYLRQLPAAEIRQALVAYDADAARVLPDNNAWETYLEAVRGNCHSLGDVVQWWKVLEPQPLNLDSTTREALRSQDAQRLLRSLRERLRDDKAGQPANLVEVLREVGRQLGLKGKQLYTPVRLALTGQAHGPELAALAPLIGAEITLRRLDDALRNGE